ncbi:mucin-5AC-like [Galleria mellonella]|uniref:Mucin-5AC-like n=1 Tax=Galleria mellonella TaxID=7137 RepID=A0A6J3CAJ3_GALME|nr:mucin-5AC-like [Galleria mellonella]XP_031769416.1 mucin-5AC-like [Galleria mellonella]
MRRQARISTGGALIVRSASALQVWLWLLIFIFQNEITRISGTIKPGYLDFDNLPETNFTCAGKVIGGYYADLETSCQMFHVCTVGQQDEPMDIKFLCLNGTVFDQETRVCERVDEVDCTKSEKFYSLNLELYGSTAPPIIQSDVENQEKPEAESTEHSKQTKTPHEQEIDPALDEISSTTHDTSKTQNQSLDIADTTEDPIQEIKKDDPKKLLHHQSTYQPIQVAEHEELTEEYQDDEDTVYEDYPHSPTTTTSPFTTTTTRTTTRSTARSTTTSTATTTLKLPTTTIFSSPSTSFRSSPVTHLFSSPSPTLSSLSPPTYSSISSSLDPSLLSPQEFIYRHRGPGSDAISFQRQSFRPADGVYITHAPPQQFDHFQYESSRTAPRPAVSRPSPFVQRPQPAPFRPTTLDPRDQLLRPGPTFQSSERHETSVKHKQSYSSLPPQRPLPFNTFYYDRKRSEDSIPEDESSLSPRSVAPPTVNERPPTKLKSPPRVIVTASASVSDSNGKRLNYTVGNVVNAVKPIVQINYDDYKESDLLFDPFFLDVPKLQKRRKNRSYRKIFTVPDTATISSELAAEKTTATMSPVTSRATTTERPATTPFTTTDTPAWNPNDYVDDNYEPHAYIPPIPPLAILVPQDRNKFRNQDRKSINDFIDDKNRRDKSEAGHLEQSKPTSAAQTISSQNTSAGSGAGVAPTVTATSLSPPPPLEAPTCASSRSSDCRTRA